MNTFFCLNQDLKRAAELTACQVREWLILASTAQQHTTDNTNECKVGGAVYS